jgi:hypothetical protein
MWSLSDFRARDCNREDDCVPYVGPSDCRTHYLRSPTPLGQGESWIHDADILTDMFWRQIEWIQPDSYIACGQDYLTFACKNRELFEAVKERLQSNLD